MVISNKHGYIARKAISRKDTFKTRKAYLGTPKKWGFLYSTADAKSPAWEQESWAVEHGLVNWDHHGSSCHAKDWTITSLFKNTTSQWRSKERNLEGELLGSTWRIFAEHKQCRAFRPRTVPPCIPVPWGKSQQILNMYESTKWSTIGGLVDFRYLYVSCWKAIPIVLVLDP